MKYYILSLVCFSLSGCWLGNSFSENCDPSSCSGTCEDNICVLGVKTDTGDKSDMAISEPDISTDMMLDTADMPVKTVCTVHTDCDQTIDLAGTELCVQGFCEQVLFEEGTSGVCDEIFLGEGEQLDISPEDTIIIPVISSLSGASNQQGRLIAVKAYKLAVQNANASGALGGRKVALIMCDDYTNEEVSRKISKKLLDRTKAISFLGYNFDGGLSLGVTPPITSRGVLAFINSTDIGYSTLPDDDLAFRNLPSDSLSIEAIKSLVQRYNPPKTGIFYRKDDPVLKLEGQTMVQAVPNAAVGAYEIGNYDMAVESVKAVTIGLNKPVDILIGIGSQELPDAISAYKGINATDYFSASRVFVPAISAFNILTLKSITGLPDHRVEMTTGAANTTQAFRTLFMSEYDAFDDVAPSLYDSAMFVLLAHAGAPSATTGAELRDVIRSKFVDNMTASADDVTFEASSVNGFAQAVAGLNDGKKIKYLGAAGGAPILFGPEGDVRYNQIAGTFTTNGFVVTRIFLGPGSIDLCTGDLIGGDCAQGYTDDGADPGQSCLPLPQNFPPIPNTGICLPRCGPGKTCPSPIFVCDQNSNLCVPAG